MLSNIESVIQQIGERYIADLRMLNEEFHRFYHVQLDAKDEQIAELNQRLQAAERACEALEAQIQHLKHAGARYVATLRALSDELGQQVDFPEHDALEAREHGETT